MKARYKYVPALAALIVLVDQLTKWKAVSALRLGESIPVIPGHFSITLVWNRGAAFGFLNNADTTWQTWLFLGVSVMAIGIIGYMLVKAKSSEILMFPALGCILGGAVGNIIDRVRFGYVIDFLDFYVGQWHWPAFNVADMGICVGAGLLALSILTHKGESSMF